MEHERALQASTSLYSLWQPQLLGRELSSASRAATRKALFQAFQHRVPGLLQEAQYPCCGTNQYDKGFDCSWINADHILIGTKCNRLICLNVQTTQVVEVPLPRVVKPAALAQASHADGHCGMHAITLSPGKELVATGGLDPSDCQIFRIKTPDGKPVLQPVQTLMGHQDWLFGAEWLTPRHLVTASRDKTAKLWQLDCGWEGADHIRNTTNMAPLVTTPEQKAKLRALKFCSRPELVATLGTGGELRLWDTRLCPVTTVKLPFDKELVCLATDGAMLAVGGLNHFMLADSRVGGAMVTSVDGIDEHGIRSLSFQDTLLTCGGSRGCISFYDLRAGRYLTLPPLSPSAPATPSPPASPRPPRPDPRPPLAGLGLPTAHARPQAPDNGPADAVTASAAALPRPRAMRRAVADSQARLRDAQRADASGDWRASLDGSGDGVRDGSDVAAEGAASRLPSEVGRHTQAGQGPPALEEFTRRMSDLLPRGTGADNWTAAAMAVADAFDPVDLSDWSPEPLRWYTRSECLLELDAAQPRRFLKCGNGWLQHCAIYMDHFFGQVIHNACYAHEWDPSGTRLFACGGPLAYGLKGSYMALWA